MGDKALIQYSAKLAMESNETFKCAVCHERLSKPIKFCKVGHLYCDTCKGKLNDCAVCHQDFSDDCNVVLDQILENSTFPCTNEIFGCKVIAKYAEINKHEELYCDFKKVQCCLNDDMTNNPCKAIIKIGDFKEHIRSEHLAREKTYFENELHGRNFIVDSGHQNFRRIEVIEVLKEEDNPNSSLFFLEKIWYNSQNKCLFISYHHVGLVKDAEKYQYFLEIKDDKNPTLVTTHRNKCLQTGLSEVNIKNSGKGLIMSLNSFMNANERRKILSLSVTLDYTEEEKKNILKRKNLAEKFKWAVKKPSKCSLNQKDDEEKKVVDDDGAGKKDKKMNTKVNEAPGKKEKEPLKIEELNEEPIIEHTENLFKDKDERVANECLTVLDVVQKWFSILMSCGFFFIQIFIYAYVLKQ